MGKRTVDRRANSPLFRDGRVNHGKSIRESLANTLLCRLDGKKVKRGRREKSHGVLVVDRWWRGGSAREIEFERKRGEARRERREGCEPRRNVGFWFDISARGGHESRVSRWRAR